jgi:hypothetical protein
MTSLRQIEANRRNAANSTGPKTEAGKLRSRRNAIRHGLSAETVVEILEDIEDYRGFEAAIIADYDARTAVERELVLRLASLLWRLRRATAIETDLLRIQGEILSGRRTSRLISQPHQSYTEPRLPNSFAATDQKACDNETRPTAGDPSGNGWCAAAFPAPSARDLSISFQRLVNHDSAVFERLGRYEAALARQAVQCMFFLRSARCR